MTRQGRRRFLALAAGGAAAAALGGAYALQDRRLNRFRFLALGAEAVLTLPGEPDRAADACAQCRRLIAQIEADFSLWDDGSTLSRLNRHGDVAAPPKRFVDLLRKSRHMSALSGGGFDPTVQALWTAQASGASAETAHDLVNWRALSIDDGLVRFLRPGMSATLNGIAQGYAADAAVALLSRLGYRDVLANMGEARGLGRRPDGKPWRLGVENPRTGAIVAEIALTPSANAAATSAPHATLVRGAAHIFDPLRRKGPRWRSVTVVADEGWKADALSTAIAAAPMQEAAPLLEAGGAALAVLQSDDGDVRRWRAS